MKERTRFAFAMIERSEFFCLEPDYLLFTSYLRVSSRIDRSEHHGRLAEQAAGFSGSSELAAAVLVGAPAGARRHRPAPPALPRRPRSLRLRLPQYSPSPPGLPPALPWLNFHDGSFRSLPDGEPHSFPLGEDTLCGGSSGCGG